MPQIIFRLEEMSPICLTSSPNQPNPPKRQKLDVDRSTAAPKFPAAPICPADVNAQNVDDIMEHMLFASRNNSGNSTANQTSSTYLEVKNLKNLPSYLESSNDIMDNNSSLFKGSTSTVEASTIGQSAAEKTITGQKDGNETKLAEETVPADKRTEIASETKGTDKNEVAPDTEPADKTKVAPETEATDKSEVAPETEATDKSEVAPETEATDKTDVADKPEAAEDPEEEVQEEEVQEEEVQEEEVQEAQDEDDMEDDEKVKSRDENVSPQSDMEE